MLRNFINSWIGKQGYIKADKLPQWLLSESEAEKWTMPDPAVYANQADLYRTLDYIGSVVDTVAKSCTDADFDVVGLDSKEIENHPLELKLKKPNQYDSRTEFMRAHYSWRVISGNSYWFLNRANEKSAPDEIWILPPSKIVPVPDGRMGLRGYLYTPGNGAEIPLEPWEVLHFKSFNPNSRYIGLSAIESLAVTAYGAKSAKEYNTRLFADNNARLPGILAFGEMIQDSDWKRMKEEVQDAAKKRNNMMLRGVGKGGIEWKQAAATHREMEFLAGLQLNKQDVYDRLAPGLFSAMQTSALTNGVNGLVLFMRSVIAPLLRETTDKINAELITVYGEGQEAQYEDVVPQDKEQEMREIELFAKFHTVDEVRIEKYGNTPDPDPERGKLLVSQVNASTGKPAPEPAPQEMPQAMDVQEPKQPEEDAEAKADLARWKRKATKNLGNVSKMAAFESEHIPADIAYGIRSALIKCQTADDVALLFQSVNNVNVKARPESEILLLADAINNAVLYKK